jgi:Gram-negative bacterial TonB protein C-terminal
MRTWIYLGVAACLAGLGAVRYGAVPSSYDAAAWQSANPEDGKLADGVFVNDYFDLSYRLPEGWTEGLAGPEPTQSGYYVLGTWAPKRDLVGTVLVVAQDMFFAPDSSEARNVVAEFRQVMSAVDGMTIDSEPAPVSVGGRPGYRIDFSGVGLFRSMIAIEIRCHVLTFNLTSRDPELLAGLVRSLDNLASVRKMSDPIPECLRDYATSENVVHRVEPDDVGAKAVSIPVRMIVATDGSVKHVHVIRASAVQRRNIEGALRQWKFKSYVRQGRPVEVETGMTFNFKPANM